MTVFTLLLGGSGQAILASAEAEGKGAILASMGTLCNFGMEEYREIARALSSLNYTVIWKVGAGDLPGNASVASLGAGPNVKVRADRVRGQIGLER